MNEINAMQGMVNQMRIMASQSKMSAPAIDSVNSTGPVTSFSDSLQNSLKTVNETQLTSKSMMEAYDRGDDVALADVMLAMQSSSMAFQATLQVRNKVLSAYQDIMKMPV
ncbi:MAG TPA: flagellar hook-basal body complex protein FliE [Oceanospirillaceae bacterium]|nr:flagellar hook-basal body complex protein FliE [Oceanospirillaceae bacterium]